MLPFVQNACIIMTLRIMTYVVHASNKRRYAGQELAGVIPSHSGAPSMVHAMTAWRKLWHDSASNMPPDACQIRPFIIAMLTWHRYHCVALPCFKKSEKLKESIDAFCITHREADRLLSGVRFASVRQEYMEVCRRALVSGSRRRWLVKTNLHGLHQLHKRTTPSR